LGLWRLESVAIDEPSFDAGLRASMQTETLSFLSRQLWDAPLGGLMSSRKTRVNASLAALYGVSFPPSGAELDAQGFADVELPETRSGLLTQAAMLAARSSRDRPSVTGRGLWVNDTLACFGISPPPPPPSVNENVAATAGEQKSVEYRMQTAPCYTCHTQIDPMGIALGNFDAIGRYRDVDSDGQPVETTTELPAGLGAIDGVKGLAQKIVEEDRMARCLSRSYLRYALAEGATFSAESCAVKNVVDAFRAGDDPAFTGILRQIALSDLLAARKP
jgi:hypothetical protein